MSIRETITQQFPIRKSKAQKAAFRAWAVQTAQELGYSAQVETNRDLVTSHNVVIGDPETAKVVYTAHYDTAPVMIVPNMITPCNMAVFVLYQVLITLVIFAAAAVPTVLLAWITKSPQLAVAMWYVMLLGMIYLMMAGPANKNCVNDNTSGVAAVYELMKRIPVEKRGDVAFILFDNEEKGLLGSSAYASKHKQVRKQTLLINMDCVGDGETILIFTKKKTRALPVYERLTHCFDGMDSRKAAFLPKEGNIYPSDQAHFQHGVAVCACKKGPRVGYYCTNLHTAKDLVCEQVNLDFLAEGFAAFTKEA